MFERILSWLTDRVWSRPTNWRIRTDDRQVRHLELRERMRAMTDRSWVKRQLVLVQPDRPVWACHRPEDDFSGQMAAPELRIPRRLAGSRLYGLADEFRRSQVAERARSQLMEMVDRIEVAAESMWAQLLDDVGAPSQGWAT